MRSTDHLRFARSPAPLYLQIADVMRQRISRGAWPVGHRLPSLEKLMAEFGVARITVRQAVELLARDGLLSSQQGRGTFVTAQPANDRWLNVVTSLDALSRVYQGTKTQIIAIDESAAAPVLGDGEGVPVERYVYMRRVHSRDGRAYCVIDIHLDEKIFRRYPKRFREETVIPLLTSMKNVTIAKAHQVLTVGTAGVEVAHLLDVPLNAPVAEVRRVFRDENERVIYLGEIVYRGDAIHVEMNLKP
nr:MULTISPECIES: GntR family transcriptional regulator [unclassified Burkholderia]